MFTRRNEEPKTEHSPAAELSEDIPGSCPSSIELGNSGWNILHGAAAVYPFHPSPEQKEAMAQFIHGFSYTYPCNWCAYHMRLYLKDHPPDVRDKLSITRFFCELHNNVNEHLNKPQYNCDPMHVLKRWHPGYPDKMEDKPSMEERVEAEKARMLAERRAKVGAATNTNTINMENKNYNNISKSDKVNSTNEIDKDDLRTADVLAHMRQGNFTTTLQTKANNAKAASASSEAEASHATGKDRDLNLESTMAHAMKSLPSSITWSNETDVPWWRKQFVQDRNTSHNVNTDSHMDDINNKKNNIDIDAVHSSTNNSWWSWFTTSKSADNNKNNLLNDTLNEENYKNSSNNINKEWNENINKNYKQEEEAARAEQNSKKVNELFDGNNFGKNKETTNLSSKSSSSSSSSSSIMPNTFTQSPIRHGKVDDDEIDVEMVLKRLKRCQVYCPEDEENYNNKFT